MISVPSNCSHAMRRGGSRSLRPPTSVTILFFALLALGLEEVDMYYFVCRTRQFH